MEAKIPAEVRPVLELLLPDYRRARGRWPLWTYNRRPMSDISQSGAQPKSARAWTWEGTNPWPDRLRWSQQVPVLAVMLGAQKHMGWPPAFLTTFRLGQTKVAIWPYSEESEEEEAESEEEEEGKVKGPTILELPLLLQARIAAVFAATAHPEIPRNVHQISLPDNWQRQCYLDDTDAEQLTAAFRRVLLSMTDATDQNETYEALLPRFLRLAGDEGSPSPGRRASAESSEALAVDLCQRVGLLPDRERGRRSVLAGETLEALRAEAEGIVAEVRDWTPGDALLECVARMLRPALEATILRSGKRQLPEDADLDALTRQRAKSQSLLLRFPFLTPAEAGRIRKEPSTVKQVAGSLVRARETADMSPSRFASIVSAARHH